jgi:hypothetical protein
MSGLTLPGLATAGFPVLHGWTIRRRSDRIASGFRDRHYSTDPRYVDAATVGPPGRFLCLVHESEQAAWFTHWPDDELAMDGLHAWRCTLFRNEGAGLSSDLIRSAMAATLAYWQGAPPRSKWRCPLPADGWVTWVEGRKIRHKRDPGRCFLRAGWTIDREWRHPHLTRLRAKVES